MMRDYAEPTIAETLPPLLNTRQAARVLNTSDRTVTRLCVAGKIKADIQLCLAICAQALNQRAASHTKTQTTNPAYTFRTWLLRMGMIGDEFATARKHLLENLEGNLAWRDPAQAERQRERMRQAALERLPQPEELSHSDTHTEPDEEQDEDQWFTMQM